MAYSIFDFAGKARQVKERINVSGLLVFCKLFFMVNLPYYESQLSFGDKGQASTFINNNKKRSHTQLDSRKQVIAFQDRVMTINIKEAQHPLK